MEATELKSYAACLEQEGLQELELAMVGTPVRQLVDLMLARVHKANKLAPPPSRAPFSSVEGQ